MTIRLYNLITEIMNSREFCQLIPSTANTSSFREMLERKIDKFEDDVADEHFDVGYECGYQAGMCDE